MKWTNTIETIAEVEQTKAKGQWRIGDAIVKDLKDNGCLGNAPESGGPTRGENSDSPAPKIETAMFGECATKLAEKGIEHGGKPYSTNYLRELFQTAYAFPRDERNSKYSWDAHKEAGTPRNLKNVVAVLRKLGNKSITIYNVRDVINKWDSDARAAREKDRKAAEAKKEAAKKNRSAAAADKLRTRDKEKRAEAEKRRQEAQKEYNEAVMAITAAGARLPFNAEYDVDPNDVGALERMALYLGITVHVTDMKRVAKKMLVDVEKLAPQLTAAEQQNIADSVSEITAILDEINKLVDRPSKPRLTGIAGGRAS